MSKKVNKFNFISFFFVIEAVVLLVSIVASIFMYSTLNPKVKYEAEYEDKISFYDDNGFDYIVSGANIDQIEEFKTKDFISNVTKVSKISLNVKTNNSEDYRNIFIFDSIDDLKYSEFTDERIISKIDSDKYVYADYKFCNLYNVNLGDAINISVNGQNQEFIISRVYRTDYLYSEGVLVTTHDMISFNSKALDAYLTTNDKISLESYLQDYKPLGTLLEKTDNQTDEDYQRYLNEFNSKNYYSSYVTELSENRNDIIDDYSQKIKNASKTFYISILVISLVCFLVSIMCFFINAKNKKDKIYRYIQENGNKKVLTIYTIFNLTFLIFITVSMIIAMKLCLNNLSVYYLFNSILSSSYLIVVAPIISILLGWIITTLKIKV